MRSHQFYDFQSWKFFVEGIFLSAFSLRHFVIVMESGLERPEELVGFQC